MLGAAATPVGYAQYKSHQVFRITIATEEQASAIQALRKQSVQLGLDWWIEPSRVLGRIADVRVPPAALDVFHTIINASQMTAIVLIQDVQTLVDLQNIDVAVKSNATFDFTKYNTLDNINMYIDEVARIYPVIASVFEVGTSSEGRIMYGVKITGPGKDIKPGFWIDGGIHAREWISPATVLYTLNQLVTGYNTDVEITKLVNSLEIYILPVFNVDGYTFTMATGGQRLWRKTRSKNKGSSCMGTDPNRNWDDHWGTVGASGDPCDETYYGSAPFSEPEVLAVARFLQERPNMEAYFNIHSYSQMFLSPYGWTNEDTKDYTVQMDCMKKAVTALEAVHGTKYVYGPSAYTIYETSGGSDDYCYTWLGIVHSYVVELRDEGQYGFLLPASQITATGEETLAAFKVVMQYVLDNPRAPRI